MLDGLSKVHTRQSTWDMSLFEFVLDYLRSFTLDHRKNWLTQSHSMDLFKSDLGPTFKRSMDTEGKSNKEEVGANGYFFVSVQKLLNSKSSIVDLLHYFF